MASPEPLSLKRTYDEAGLEDTVHDHRAAPSIIGDRSPMVGTTDSLGTLMLPPSAAEHTRPNFLAPKDTNTVAVSQCTLSTPNAHAISTTNKRPKLSATEKEAKRLEKEAKDRQRAEEKEKKEEKQLKDVEKEERRKLKEDQSRLKEEERKVKEDEKRRKEDEKKRKDEEKRLKEDEKDKKAKASSPWNQQYGSLRTYIIKVTTTSQLLFHTTSCST